MGQESERIEDFRWASELGNGSFDKEGTMRKVLGQREIILRIIDRDGVQGVICGSNN